MQRCCGAKRIRVRYVIKSLSGLIHNTSGKTKAAIYERIGAKILPEHYKIDSGKVRACVKSKVEEYVFFYHRYYPHSPVLA